MPRGREGQVKPWMTGADVLTALRIPLAVVFPFLRHPVEQLGAVAVAAASDFFDGVLARRFGSSRAGAVLDTVADKLFLVAAIAGSSLVRPLAWATAAIGLYAIWDYGRAVAHARARPNGE